MTLFDATGKKIPTVTDNSVIQTDVDSGNAIWKQWNERLAFGMNTSQARVPVLVDGQMLVDGTLMVHNNAGTGRNRWGFHVMEAYAQDNYSRMTMLVDKHRSEIDRKPSLEYYYYIGADHHAESYGNVKIGSDVKNHSFLFDRDKLTAMGEIDCHAPVNLARISAADMITDFATVEAADDAYEPEQQSEKHAKCLQYIAIQNAQDGGMYYDADRDRIAVKIAGKWRYLALEEDVPCTGITLDSELSIDTTDSVNLTANVTPDNTSNPVLWSSSNSTIASVSGGVVTPHGNGTCAIIAKCGDYCAICTVTVSAFGGATNINDVSLWESGVIGGQGENADNIQRIRTIGYIPDSAKTISVDSGFQYAIVCYNNAGEVKKGNAYFDVANNTFSSAGAVYTANTVNLDDVRAVVGDYSNFRIILKTTVGSATLVSEAVHLKMLDA
jgi:hypothetical protein